MNEMSDNGKDKEAIPDSNSEEPKKKPDLDATLSRLLRRQADVDEGEGEESSD